MTNMNELSMNELDNVVGGKGTCLIIEDSANCFEAITVTGDFSRDEMFAIYNYKVHNSPISKDLKNRLANTQTLLSHKMDPEGRELYMGDALELCNNEMTKF